MGKLASTVLKIERPAKEDGTLFGKVSAKEVAEGILQYDKIKINAKQVELPEEINKIGNSTALIRLAKGVSATIKVIVKKAN